MNNKYINNENKPGNGPFTGGSKERERERGKKEKREKLDR